MPELTIHCQLYVTVKNLDYKELEICHKIYSTRSFTNKINMMAS